MGSLHQLQLHIIRMDFPGGPTRLSVRVTGLFNGPLTSFPINFPINFPC